MDSSSQEVPKTPVLFDTKGSDDRIVPSIELSSDSNSCEDFSSDERQIESIEEIIDDQIVPQIMDQSFGDCDQLEDNIETKINSINDNPFDERSDTMISSDASVANNSPIFSQRSDNVLIESRLNLNINIKRKLISKRFDKTSKVFKRRVSIFYELSENGSNETELEFFDINNHIFG